MTLYEISEEYAELLNNLTIDEETGELLNAAELEIAETEFNEKAENYAKYIKNLRAGATAIKAERQKLQDREKAAERKAEALQARLVDAMNRIGKTQFETAAISLLLKRSEAINITDENILPSIYLRQTVKIEPDKIAIKKAIDAGETVNGAEIVINQNLIIK